MSCSVVCVLAGRHGKVNGEGAGGVDVGRGGFGVWERVARHSGAVSRIPDPGRHHVAKAVRFLRATAASVFICSARLP